MSHLSPSSLHLLRTLEVGSDPDPRRPRSSIAMGPTIVVIRQPLADPETVVELLDEVEPVGRRRNRVLERSRAVALGIADGQLVYNGRRCCMELIERIHTDLHRLVYPVQFTCDPCGTVYEVRMDPREERHHG